MLMENSRNFTTHFHTTQHNSFRPTTMSKQKLNMTFCNQKGEDTTNKIQRGSKGSTKLPALVETAISSSSSLTSSIGIGEFGMNPACKGNAAAFSMAIKDNLFPKLKFLQGTNVSLDFSMDTKSVCGFLRLHCNVAEADAYQWWEDHCMLLKTIHTDCRNNKIKMIKQQFNGEFIHSAIICNI
jgi:hypothetical protein